MLASTEALAPVFLTILVGVALYRTKLVGDDMWSVLEHVCYYVLFPALMFEKIAAADLSQAPVLRMGGAMMLAIATMAVALLAARITIMTRFTMTGAAYTSVFQGSTRWHTFVALSIIALLHGEEGITLAAIGMAAMIPFLNILNVIVISTYAEGTRPSAERIAALVVRNPLVLACVAGALYNFSGLALPPPVQGTLQLIGSGALGIGLLTVGAALRPRAALVEFVPVAMATGLRLIAMPILMFAWTTILGIDGLAQAVAVICGAVPTTSASYILARQLGGDSVLMANIITAQVVAAAVTLPAMIWLLTG
jgi:hypothetical protein